MSRYDGKRASAAGPKGEQKKAADEREAVGQERAPDEPLSARGRIDPRRIDGARDRSPI